MLYVLAVIFIVNTAGCIKKDSIRYITLPAKPADQVELLPGPPDKPYQVVGHVFIDGSNKRGWQSIAEAAREEAAEMGADAVFIGNIGQYQSGTMSSPNSSTTSTASTFNRSSMNTNSTMFTGPTVVEGIMRKQLSATAIMYKQ